MLHLAEGPATSFLDLPKLSLRPTWTTVDTDAIGRANLTGQNADQSFITGASSPAGVAVGLR
jgi:hypothetical protein